MEDPTWMGGTPVSCGGRRGWRGSFDEEDLANLRLLGIGKAQEEMACAVV